VIVPVSSFAARGLVDGEPRLREMSGLGDPRFRVSVNLIGAPAMSVKDFANYRQDLIVARDFEGRWFLDIRARSQRDLLHRQYRFFGGNNFPQAPFYAVQGHILYTFQSGTWVSLDGVYFSGGHTSLNGVKSDNEQRNTPTGFTVALPIDRQNSLKLSASTGIATRTGSEFTAVGVAWQYRWSDGY